MKRPAGLRFWGNHHREERRVSLYVWVRLGRRTSRDPAAFRRPGREAHPRTGAPASPRTSPPRRGSRRSCGGVSSSSSRTCFCCSSSPAWTDLADRAEQLADASRGGAIASGAAPARTASQGVTSPAFSSCSVRPVVGEGEAALAVGVLAADQALVLEHLQRRVDRAGARGPGPLGALLDLFDHLVAVHRALGEQGEDGGADVTAARPRPAAPAAVAGTATARELGVAGDGRNGVNRVCGASENLSIDM